MAKKLLILQCDMSTAAALYPTQPSVQADTRSRSVQSEYDHSSSGTLSDELNEIVVNHILDCDTCLSVVSDLQLPTNLCEVRCPVFRALVSKEDERSCTDLI